VAHPGDGILLSTKNKCMIKPWKKLKCKLLSVKSQSEKATGCMSPTTRHSGKGKTTGTLKKNNAARGWREGRMQRRNTGIFRTVKLIICVTL
jgi:hypothetical protein